MLPELKKEYLFVLFSSTKYYIYIYIYIYFLLFKQIKEEKKQYWGLFFVYA